MAHIHRCIPSLEKQITMTVQQKERELITYDTACFELGADKCGPIVLNMITNFQREYEHLLEGTFIRDIASETQGGARINYIFHKIFKNVIETIDPFENLNDQDIQTAIKNAQAMGTSLFVPEGAFEVLIKQQIIRVLEPSIECAHLIYEELRRIVLQIKLPEL